MAKSVMQSIVMICSFCIILGCSVNRSKSAGQESSKDTVTVTGCQEEINLQTGKIAEIRLEAISGTGYQWTVKNQPLLLEQLDTETLKYTSAEGKEDMPGHAAYQILYFKALKQGEEQIQLEYRRTFEVGVDKTCTIKFVVR